MFPYILVYFLAAHTGIHSDSFEPNDIALFENRNREENDTFYFADMTI